MTLHLEQLLPIPLKASLALRPSQIWLQDLQWQQGERIFVQAPSGTGKTTLLHILYGMRQDYEGSVRWDDRPVQSLDAGLLAGLRAGPVSIIFQDLRIFPGLTAWENLEVKRRLTETVSAEEVGEWVERLGIGPRRNALGHTLSYGEQQRLAIIRSLLQPFCWLLMDEPFSHLDKANARIAAALIGEVCDRRQAGFLLADLDENASFPYTQTLLL